MASHAIAAEGPGGGRPAPPEPDQDLKKAVASVTLPGTPDADDTKHLWFLTEVRNCLRSPKLEVATKGAGMLWSSSHSRYAWSVTKQVLVEDLLGCAAKWPEQEDTFFCAAVGAHCPEARSAFVLQRARSILDSRDLRDRRSHALGAMLHLAATADKNDPELCRVLESALDCGAEDVCRFALDAILFAMQKRARPLIPALEKIAARSQQHGWGVRAGMASTILVNISEERRAAHMEAALKFAWYPELAPIALLPEMQARLQSEKPEPELQALRGLVSGAAIGGRPVFPQQVSRFEITAEDMNALKRLTPRMSELAGSGARPGQQQGAKEFLMRYGILEKHFMAATPDWKPPRLPTSEEIAAEKRVKQCRAWLNMAENYERSGMKKEAREYLQKVIGLNPGSEFAKQAAERLKGL